MKRTIATLTTIAAVLAVCIALVGTSTRATPATIAQSIGNTLTGYASGELVPFEVTCATTATRIAPSGGGGFSGASCYNVSSTSVFVGGAAVANSAAYCLSTTAASCGSNIMNIDMDANAGYCRVASGTVTLYCLGAK